METSHIREFATLAECLSFSEAAERLYISQSSLSKHIQAMERELGTELFIRTTRSIRLSEAGKAYLPYARKMTDLCSEAESAVNELIRREQPALTIAVMQNPQYYGLANYMVSFRQAHPGLAFSMVEADEFGLYDMFRKKTVNIFPTYSNFKAAGDYDFMPMVRSTIVAIVHRDHPLANAKKITLDQLSRERLLLPTRGGSLSNLIHDAFNRAGVTPDIVYEGSSIGCIDLVKAGMGASLHAREFATSLSRDGEVSSVAIDPEISFTYGLGHRPESMLSPSERLYLAHMRKFALR